MPDQNNQQYIFGIVLNRYVLILLVVILVGFLLWYFSEIVSWLIIAWVLSMIGRPLMQLFQKIKIGTYKVGSTLAAGMTLLCYFLGIGIFVGMFVPMIVSQAQNLSGVDYSAVIKTLEEPLFQIDDILKQYGLGDGETSVSLQIENGLKEYFDPSTITTWVSSFVSAAGSILISIFSIIFITFFFLKEAQLFTSTLQKLTPKSFDDKIVHVVQDSSKMLSRYFSGVLLQVSLVTMGLWLGLSIIGVPNALLIAFLASLFNVIPYIGPLIGASIGIFLTITSNLGLDFYSEMLPLLGKVSIVFIIMQLMDNFLLQPFIFSKRVNAHPLEIFIVVLAGSQIAGILGMVIAIPFYTVIRIIARNFLSEFDIIKNLTKGVSKDEVAS
ncbi:MAG: AI-2E family transporter [Saprospiraceae bacterium]